MNMHCREGLMWTRVPGGQCLRALLPACLLVAVLLGPSACLQPVGSTGETVEIDVLPGETASGSLYSGQELRAIGSVQRGHIYSVSASLSAATPGSTGPDVITGLISGAPLAEPVEFEVESAWDGGSQGLEPNRFAAQADGEVVIEFAYVSTQDVGSAGDSIESIRSLIRGRMRADYELLLTDLGFDEEGMSPEDAVTLAVGMEGEQLGTLTPGDEADYFTLQVQADVTYRLTLESTAAVSVTSGCQDRFGQTNFGVATAEGLIINCDASAGSPCSTEVLAPATEEVLLRLTGTISDPSSALTIQYAISVVEVEVEDEGEAEEEGEVEVVPGA